MRILLRSLFVSSRGFSAAVILTGALAIGAATLILALADPFLMRPMPFDAGQRIYHLWETNRKQQGAERQTLSSPARIEDYRRGLTARSFEAVSAYYSDSMTLRPAATAASSGGEAPVRIIAARPMPGYFQVFPVRPVMGRVPSKEEEAFGGPKVAVVSYSFWQTHLHSNPNALQTSIRLGPDLYTVIGVLPPEFQYPSRRTQLYVPAQLYPRVFEQRAAQFMIAVVRLKPGVSALAAGDEAQAVFRESLALDPPASRERDLQILSLRDELVGANTRLTLWTLVGAVGLLLLTACGNIAGLMVARANRRFREFAVRLAIGANRADLLWRILSENLVLFAIAGVAGLLLSIWLLDAIRTAPLPLPGFATIEIDYRVAFFTLALTFGAAMLASIAPGVAQARVDLIADGLKRTAGRTATGGRQGIRGWIVAGEVALAMVLLVCSGLLGRGFSELSRTDLGFQTERRLTFTVSYPWETDPKIYYALQKQVLAALQESPDVEAAGLINFLPLRAGFTAQPAYPADRPAPPPNQWPNVDTRTVSPGYFRAVGTPLLQGNLFPDQAEPGRPQVMVNQAFARAYFPGDASAAGRRVWIGPPGVKTASYEIAGVVGDARNNDLTEAPKPQVFYNFHEARWPMASYVVATRTDPVALASSVRQIVKQIDPNQAVTGLQTMAELVGQDLARPKLNMVVLCIFAAAAVLLTGLGLYSVIAMVVATQTREIGLRAALGAQSRQIAAWVVGGAGRMVAFGAGAGGVASWFAAKWLAANIYGVRANDPAVWFVSSMVLGLTAFLAVAVPARRAVQIEPIEALRED